MTSFNDAVSGNWNDGATCPVSNGAGIVQGDANNIYSLTDDVWLNAQSLNIGKHLLYCH